MIFKNTELCIVIIIWSIIGIIILAMLKNPMEKLMQDQCKGEYQQSYPGELNWQNKKWKFMDGKYYGKDN